MCELPVPQAASVATIDPLTSLTLVLAGLAALLTVLAIIIGIAAIWGYIGLRDSVREMASRRVDEAMDAALNKYPKSADMLQVLQRLKQHADFMDQVRNVVVTAPDPKTVAPASKAVVQGVVAETPLESVDRQVTPIAKYPGEPGQKEEHGDEHSDSGTS